MLRYKVKWEDKVLESLSKLDEITEQKIKHEIEKHLTADPFWHGKPLWGRWKGFWRCHREKEIIIVVVKVGERKGVYKGELPCSTFKNHITERPKIRDSKRKVSKK